MFHIRALKGEANTNVLVEVKVPLVERHICNASYVAKSRLKRQLPTGIIDTMLCAGDTGKDSCQARIFSI
jgi:hypothetical protein